MGFVKSQCGIRLGHVYNFKNNLNSGRSEERLPEVLHLKRKKHFKLFLKSHLEDSSKGMHRGCHNFMFILLE